MWDGPLLFTVSALYSLSHTSKTQYFSCLLQQSSAAAEPSGLSSKHEEISTEIKSISRCILSLSKAGYLPFGEPGPARTRIFSHRQSQYLAQRLAAAECPVKPLLLQLFQNPIPSLQHFCLPSDQDLSVICGCYCRKNPKSFCCNATSNTTSKCSLHSWSSLEGYEQDTQRASSGAGPEAAAWNPASLTIGFLLTSADLSVEIKYETVIASIVCILGVALNKQKERNWDTGPDMLQLSVTTSSLLHCM